MPTRKSRRLAVYFNLLLGAMFCGALTFVPLMALSPGSSWMARIGNAPATLAEVSRISQGATIATYILPLIGVLISIAGLGVSLVGQSRQTISRAVSVAFWATLAVATIAAVLLRDIPILSVALLPLGFAVYAARKLD